MKPDTTIYGMIVPHAPTLLEDELDGRETPVITALRQAGQELKAWNIDAVVAISTHWQTQEFRVDDSALHQTVTDYYGFRREIRYDVPGHPALARHLLQAGRDNLIFAQPERHGADHAISIPLYFMFPERDVPVIPLSIAGSALCAFRWGRTLGSALREWGGNVLVLASGSLSHDLHSFATGRILTEHQLFDQQVLQQLMAGNGMDLLQMNPDLIKLAKPEGEFRDLFMLLGILGSKSRGRVEAYESLPGVGLGVVSFAAAQTASDDLYYHCAADSLIQ